ncbi:M24 family metallopeptidase [Silvibacterium sp.]|uniref:M24 family metallopeptidase n=1 Tax=Silvibacterium sp. TaxID=1964179 RepID=UPI0039E50E95
MADQPQTVDHSEEQKVTELRNAQDKAVRLFHEVEARGLIRAGITESRLNQEVYDLAKQMYGISTYWHKRIVRAGENTLAPYAENPPDHTLNEDDILFLDLGPVFEQYEADFGRTYVIGSDPLKLKLRDDVGKAFADGKHYFQEHPEIRADELFAYAVSLAEKYGWEFGGPIAGHLIGQFPHERIQGDKISLYIHPESDTVMNALDEEGRPRHWILEIHFVDKARKIGGFFEELLTIG